MKKLKLIHKMTLLLLAAFTAFACEKTNDMGQPGYLVPKTVDEDPSLPSITVNGTMLHSEAFGNPMDPMIVSVHGGPGGDYRSILNCKKFADDGYYVIFYDQRGSGLSKRHDEDEGVFTVQTFVDDLDAVINYYKQSPEQKVILMGHSWGGMLAAEFVNQYPEKVDGLIIMEAGGLIMDDMMEYVNTWMKYDLFSEGVNDIVYKDQFITGNTHEILDYKMAIQPHLDENVGNPGHTPFWRMGAVCNSALMNYAMENPIDFTTNLDQYTNKVFFAYSELNPAYGKEHAEKVAGAFPNVEVVEIKQCGHEIPYYGWASYYPVALAYLNQITK
jgi:proline iminopeptidase